MKRFRIYEHPALGRQAVKIGFSWPAFFFGFFWLLSKKLWRFAGIWIVIYLSMTLLDNAVRTGVNDPLVKTVMGTGLFVAYLTIMFIPAFLGNSWREKKLVAKGYAPREVVDAPSSSKAQQLADQNRLDSSPT
jgi:hypothetical protein